jgi:hypothetical protein
MKRANNSEMLPREPGASRPRRRRGERPPPKAGPPPPRRGRRARQYYDIDVGFYLDSIGGG